MSLQQELGVKDVIAHIIDDVAKAISERPGEDRREQATRVRVATAAMEDFHPQDVAQAMLAGFCVMFHAVMTDSVHITLRGELETMRRATRSNIVAMNKSFHINLERLDGFPKQDAARLADEADFAAPAADVAITPEPVVSPAAEVPAPEVTPGPLAVPEASHLPALEAHTPEVTSVPMPAAPRAPAPNGAAEIRHRQVPIGAAQPRHPHAQYAGASGHPGQKTGGNGSVPTAPVPAIAEP